MARQINMIHSSVTDILLGYGVTWLTGYITLCLPDIFILKDFTDTRETYETVFHELAHASHYSLANKPYWLLYVAGVISNGSENPYGDGSGSLDGYIGIGEMWGYYFEYVTVKQYFGNGTPLEESLWFKPQILDRLVSVYNFTPGQLFNCLTGNVNNHTELKNKIKSNYGRVSQVNEAFSYYGF